MGLTGIRNDLGGQENGQWGRERMSKERELAHGNVIGNEEAYGDSSDQQSSEEGKYPTQHIEQREAAPSNTRRKHSEFDSDLGHDAGSAGQGLKMADSRQRRGHQAWHEENGDQEGEEKRRATARGGGNQRSTLPAQGLRRI